MLVFRGVLKLFLYYKFLIKVLSVGLLNFILNFERLRICLVHGALKIAHRIWGHLVEVSLHKFKSQSVPGTLCGHMRGDYPKLLDL